MNVRLPHAELLLDTDRAAVGVGMRAAAVAPRQLVYRFGAHQLEVMAPTSPAGAPAAARFVWGQILDGADVPCAATRVAWVDAHGEVVAESSTDAFGEFRLAAPPAQDGALRVDAADGAFLCWLPPVAAPRATEPRR